MEQETTEIIEINSLFPLSTLFSKACITKAVEKVLPIHKAQLLSYMKLLDVPLGLIINFHSLKLTEGVSRLILPGANVA